MEEEYQKNLEPALSSTWLIIIIIIIRFVKRQNVKRLPWRYLLSLLCGCLLVFDEICLRSVNFVRSRINHHSNLVKFIARYSIFYGRFRSPAGRNVLYCAQRYSCAVEDLLFTQSARKTVSSRVRERLSDEQLLTARLLQECIMVRVETVWLVCLMLLRLVICLILFVTCVCADCSVFLSVLSFLLWSPYVIGQTIHIFIL